MPLWHQQPLKQSLLSSQAYWHAWQAASFLCTKEEGKSCLCLTDLEAEGQVWEHPGCCKGVREQQSAWELCKRLQYLSSIIQNGACSISCWDSPLLYESPQCFFLYILQAKFVSCMLAMAAAICKCMKASLYSPEKAAVLNAVECHLMACRHYKSLTTAASRACLPICQAVVAVMLLWMEISGKMFNFK